MAATGIHVGYVALAGRPNVGKSTLLNSLLKQKLAIVSPRPQTTRTRILGILNGPNHQIVLLDTPGIIEPRYTLQKTMRDTALSTIKEADIVMLLIESEGLSEEDHEIIQILSRIPAPKFVLINKIDLIEKQYLLPLIERLEETQIFQQIIPISALKQDGMDIIVRELIRLLPCGEPLYSQDILSDEPMRFFASEIIREKIFMLYGQEIPYATAVAIESYEEKPGKKDFIHAVIYIERDSQKGILIGKEAALIKKLGQLSREAIEDFVQKPIYLQLEVKVSKNWRKNPAVIRKLGYQKNGS